MSGTSVDGADAVFISPEQLWSLLRGSRGVDVLDVRWQLGRSDGRERYLAGHIPGAVYVDLETELAGPASPEQGRHPLPDVAVFAEAARRWGLCEPAAQRRPVVVYDTVGGMSAARAWWLLRWAGHPDVRILDGGLDAWARFQVRPFDGLETGEVHPEPGTFVVRPGHLPVLDGDGAAELACTGILLDARAGERYRGETEPIDPRAGHIPGALSAPTADNLAANGTFLPAAELRDRFAGLGVRASEPEIDSVVGVYCGSGVTAAHEVAALASIGVRAALYAGSWSQWSADPRRPVATGA